MMTTSERSGRLAELDEASCREVLGPHHAGRGHDASGVLVRQLTRLTQLFPGVSRCSVQ